MDRKAILYKNISDTLKICKKILRELGWNVEKIEGNTITASTGFSLRSWGEIVTIHLKKIDTNTTEIYVESKPKAQLFDWGKSQDNELLFIDKLSEIGGVNV